MALVFANQECSPLKRPSLGPPDVYPQSKKQKEDELTPHCVKHGFPNPPIFSNEHGSAHRENYDITAIADSLASIVEKKTENSALPDGAKKKSHIGHKDNFMHVTSKNKPACDQWFKDLADNKPLSTLAKKVPIFNKKEDVYVHLGDYTVPSHQAIWFIKMSAAQSAAAAEARPRRRQALDVPHEWTVALTRFMKDQLVRAGVLANAPPSSGGGPGSGTAPGGTSGSSGASPFHPSTGGSSGGHYGGTSAHGGEDTGGGGVSAWAAAGGVAGGAVAGAAMRLWSYCEKLSGRMYEEGLLDEQEFLSWLIELLETHARGPVTKASYAGVPSATAAAVSNDDNNLRLLLATTFKYIEGIAQQYLLARRMAEVCVRRLNHILHISGFGQHRSESPVPREGTPTPVSQPSGTRSHQVAVLEILNEYTTCPQHRAIIMQLCGALQVITLRCPAALVWVDLRNKSSPSVTHGSPLDALPVSPACLPMPNPTVEMRLDIRRSEKEIIRRALAAEAKWTSDKLQQSKSGRIIE